MAGRNSKAIIGSRLRMVAAHVTAVTAQGQAHTLSILYIGGAMVLQLLYTAYVHSFIGQCRYVLQSRCSFCIASAPKPRQFVIQFYLSGIVA